MFVWWPLHTFYKLFAQPVIRRDPADCCKRRRGGALGTAPMSLRRNFNLIRRHRELLWITRCGLSRIQAFTGGFVLRVMQLIFAAQNPSR